LISEVEAFCKEGRNIIVVNEDILCKDTEECAQDSLDPLPELAERFKYSLHITKWNEVSIQVEIPLQKQ